MNAEQQRLEHCRQQQAAWKKWGTYLSERQWGTVREDYSADGSAWDYFPHDQARSRAYRWGEDGILGISDTQQLLCFAIALWNGRDPYLKERIYGLAGPQGNHGEDGKDYYFYLDSTPTHSYLKGLYKYPQAEFPYQHILEETWKRDRTHPEYELVDTGIFTESRYFDVVVEYAKGDVEDILIQITVVNRGAETAELRLLPTLWCRNTWAWDFNQPKPLLKIAQETPDGSTIAITHPTLGDYWFYCQNPGTPLFTDNDTNTQRLFGTPNPTPYVKDGIHNYVVAQQSNAVNPQRMGTKMAVDYSFSLQPGESQTVKLRLCRQSLPAPFGTEFEQIWSDRVQETDTFYRELSPCVTDEDMRQVQRQAFAGMLWSKQFFHYDVTRWLEGDPTMPVPPPERKKGRNAAWFHLDNADIISMPDKWEYPWYAAWDLAFHCVPLAMVDPEFAKNQLDLMTREWYMHPNGQIPAYEWNFSDVNPPVHAWGAWRIYKIEEKMRGQGDRQFLERIFQKLLLNFTWWVNRKDAEGNNVFEGGFLGLDNIGAFDRSAPLPTGGRIEQADGTSWMAMFCLNMLTIALELASENPVYEDMATKFFEHYIYIARAMNDIGGDGTELWDPKDGFYYDVLHLPDDQRIPMKVRSMVGLIPLYAVMTLEPELLEKVPGFKARLDWFINNRPDLRQYVACMRTTGQQERRILAIAWQERLEAILHYLLDETEFLSEYGIRALSRYHKDHPYVFEFDGNEYRVDYDPGESSIPLFGGNSNWRGPVWFPVNFLIIESLQNFYSYLGDDFKVECPHGSGQMKTLREVAAELELRLIKLFLKDPVSGRRPFLGDVELFQNDPHWQNHILFYEYFHGDNGRGVGAAHQTGWTGLVAKLIQEYSEFRGQI